MPHRHPPSPLNKAALALLQWPRSVKRGVALAFDALLCMAAVALAFYLRLNELRGPAAPVLWASLISVAIALPIFISFGLYRAIFRYSGLPAQIAIGKAIALYAVAYAAVFMGVGVPGVPRTIGLLQPLLLLLFVGGSRALARLWLGGLYQTQLRRGRQVQRVLVYGAGEAGRQIATAMNTAASAEVLGYLDDDDRLHGHALNGLRIHSPADLPRLVQRLSVTSVLLAIPSASRARRAEILAQLAPLGLQVRTLPGLDDIASGRIALADIRELDIDDLLGRDPVKPNGLLLNRHTRGKTVLITGAGGSIGSELCRQILACRPERLLLLEVSEPALYTIHQELSAAVDAAQAADPDRTHPEVIALLGNVTDAGRIDAVMQAYTPHLVVHAAAYKHVPIVEHNPAEGLRNNVWGTWVCAQAALRNGVPQFVLVSTDKAVRPTNIMGASKRLAEMVLQALQAEAKGTQFSMVRFGNVLGSSGSVVPLFRQQIAAGGPITLTHADITRYFMTIPEAAQLVIQAGAMGSGGDVFVLDMGEPVRIEDLAHRMIELSGLTLKSEESPNGDIEVVVTGLRPGEKLYEELLIGDNPEPTQHARILKAQETFLPWQELQSGLQALEKAMQANDLPQVRALLQQLVPGYTPDPQIVDWLWKEAVGAG